MMLGPWTGCSCRWPRGVAGVSSYFTCRSSCQEYELTPLSGAQIESRINEPHRHRGQRGETQSGMFCVSSLPSNHEDSYEDLCCGDSGRRNCASCADRRTNPPAVEDQALRNRVRLATTVQFPAVHYSWPESSKNKLPAAPQFLTVGSQIFSAFQASSSRGSPSTMLETVLIVSALALEPAIKRARACLLTGVELPDVLKRKYPRAALQLGWQFRTRQQTSVRPRMWGSCRGPSANPAQGIRAAA
jgi:hypothetical protein